MASVTSSQAVEKAISALKRSEHSHYQETRKSDAKYAEAWMRVAEFLKEEERNA